MKVNKKKIANKELLTRVFLASLIVLPLPMENIMAADLSPMAREEQNQRLLQESREREARQEQKDVFMQEKEKSKESIALPQEDISFYIQQIQLEGEKTEKFSWLQAEIEKYQERKIGMQGIQMLVKQLENSLIDRGYITTRIVIPEQDLATGSLRIALLEGKINQIRMEEESDKLHWQNAFPAQAGDILNLRHLEQGLEQLKRIQSREVDMQIVPAEQLGMSDIVLTAKAKNPISFTTSIGDYGSEATGKRQIYNTLKIDNLLNANDILTLSFNDDGEHQDDEKGTQGEGFSYSIPNGNWTYTLSRNNYQYHQTIWSHINKFIFSGTSEEYRFYAEKLLTRNQTSKTYLQIGINRKSSHSYVQDTEILLQRKQTTALNLGLYRRQYINQDLLDLNVSYKCGVPWLNAQEDFAEKNSQLPTTHYNLWNFDATYIKPIKVGRNALQYRFTLSGQYTKDYLYAVDCMSIGNRYTVRGFDGEETLIGEKGFYIQNELSIPIEANHQLFLGLDYGYVTGPSTMGYSSKSLLGGVVGLRGELWKNMQYEIFVGWPLKKPDELITAKQAYGFQATYRF